MVTFGAIEYLSVLSVPSHRLSQLKIDLERQKKKEAEDMAVLEKAVLQVEENLVTTTVS